MHCVNIRALIKTAKYVIGSLEFGIFLSGQTFYRQQIMKFLAILIFCPGSGLGGSMAYPQSMVGPFGYWARGRKVERKHGSFDFLSF